VPISPQILHPFPKEKEEKKKKARADRVGLDSDGPAAAFIGNREIRKKRGRGNLTGRTAPKIGEGQRKEKEGRKKNYRNVRSRAVSRLFLLYEATPRGNKEKRGGGRAPDIYY